MKIGGFIPCSFVDWEGEISSLIFTQGCNWKCPYCHAAPLHTKCEEIEHKKIFDFLKEKKGWITSIVISGGEPTIYGKSLISFIKKLKKMDLAICLRTNGSNPDVVQKLTKDMLIDKISVDFKTSFERYVEVADTFVKVEDVIKTFELIQKETVEIEYRTVLCPDFIGYKEIAKMGTFLENKRGKWILSEFSGRDVLNGSKLSGNFYDEESLNKLLDFAFEYVDDVELYKI